MFGEFEPWVYRVVNGVLIALAALAVVGCVSVVRWVFGAA